MGPRLEVAAKHTVKEVDRLADDPDQQQFAIEFGREVCGDLSESEKREWLVTNGIGGFASGTVAGMPTRRYHGLLVAALKPPLGRTLLVSHLEETIESDGHQYELSTCRWRGGAVSPQGFRQIESFRLEGSTPVWTFACGDALIEKRIWMEHGANTTFVTYKLARGSRTVRIECKALVNYRDYHASTHASDWQMSVEPTKNGVRVIAFEGALPFYLMGSPANTVLAHDWYHEFDLAAERYRGLDDREDHVHAATFRANLSAEETLTIVASTDNALDLNGDSAYRRQKASENLLVERFEDANSAISSKAPAWIHHLALAADQFVADRPLSDDPGGKTLIAGYHWFGDWGRDTMIALPGLTLTTGRPEIAARILQTFAKFVDGGMLPNVFPDAGQTPEYNTVDATLWYFEAVRQYVAATNDIDLLKELYPVLVEIVDAHLRGTRYQIHADPKDGLLYAGETGVQLTWMDARVAWREVTPRIGKPVEINALWLNAVSTMTEFARLLGRPTAGHACLVKRARKGFARFWNEAGQCCFDVLDGPNGNDASIRPNQIFAVSLPESALSPEQRRAVVDTCGRHLLTSHGLRSLSPDDPQYRGQYGGPPSERDSAYHQGTVWGWLLGPFALAHLRVYNNPDQAASFLDPIANHLKVHGLGSVSEIFDGDAPFTPRGCIAQAWSVAEVLRAWAAIAQAHKDRARIRKRL
jgi:predicted glycogen debranching enzyme